MISKYHYTDSEIKELMKGFVILIDTREKQSHIKEFCESKGIKYKVKALDYGDYSFMLEKNEKLNIPRDMYFDKDVVIERKGSLEELSGNLTKDRARFEKELSLAPKEKVLLIENADYKDITDGNYDTQLSKSAFLASIHKFWFKYRIPFIFIKDKSKSGIFIYKYFEYYFKNFIS